MRWHRKVAWALRRDGFVLDHTQPGLEWGHAEHIYRKGRCFVAITSSPRSSIDVVRDGAWRMTVSPGTPVRLVLEVARRAQRYPRGWADAA